MSALCIATPPGITCDPLLRAFMAAGMEHLTTGGEGKIDSIESWQRRIVQANPDVTQPLKIGTIWQQMISDLYLTMIERPCWGWRLDGDARLLDFWAEFDPSIRFILLTTPLDFLLSHLLDHHPDVYREKTVPEWTEAWTDYHQKVLAFHLRHPDQSVLLDLEEFLQAPGEAITRLARRWSLDLSEVGPTDLEALQPSPLARFLIAQTLSTPAEIDGIVREIDDCRLILETKGETEEASNIAEAYIALRTEATQTPQLQEEIQTLNEELENLRIQFGKLQHTLQDLDQQYEQTRQRLEASQAKCDQLGKEKEEAQQENELLLLQLHQVQEELEQYYQKYQELEAALTQEKEARSTLAQEKASLQQQLQTSQAERQKIEQERAKLEQERDAQAKLAQERQAQIQVLNQQLGQIRQRIDTLQAERDQLGKEKEEAQQENELLLLQLHQVQEELEQYFLRHQEARQEIDRWKARWARMLERNPDYVDYERLTVLTEPHTPQVRWRFENIDIAGRTLPTLEFRTLIEGPMGGLEFERESAAEILTRWPNVAGMEETLELIPAGKGKVRAARLQALLSLAPSDLTLVRTLAHFLATQGIETQEARKVLDAKARSNLRLGLELFRDAFDQLPPTFRYDRIELKREQVNPDYEHLWFRFDRAAFGEAQADAFEFRVSCANVRPNVFGKHPKLEFPEGEGAALFEKWYEESWDDFSSKWELRFALPRDMDMEVWNSVSDHDRALVRAIVDRLPAFFEEVAAQGFTPKRGWEDWHTMAAKIKNILDTHAKIAENA